MPGFKERFPLHSFIDSLIQAAAINTHAITCVWRVRCGSGQRGAGRIR